MKAGVLHYNVKSEKIDDFKKALDQFLSELHQENPGFHAGLLFINPDLGKALSIGFYDDEESAQPLLSTASYKKFLSEIREYVNAEPTRELFDVSGDIDRITGEREAA